MTRSEAIATITRTLASFDDEHVLAVAGIVAGMNGPPDKPIRALSDRETALLAQSKADFAAGRTFSLAEVIAHTDAALAALGVPPHKA